MKIWPSRLLEIQERKYKSLIENNPADAESHHQLGLVHRRMGALDSAIRDFREAIRLDPKRRKSYRMLAGILISQKKWAEGSDAVVADLRFDEPPPPTSEGIRRLSRRDNERGKDELEKWHREAADNPASARAHNNLGLCLMSEGRLDEAIVEEQEAIRLDPKLPNPHFILGNIFILKGENENAFEEFEVAIRLAPSDAEMRKHYADMLAADYRCDEALPHYRTYLAAEPDDAETWRKLGLCFQARHIREPSIHALESAEQAYMRALEIDPHESGAKSMLPAVRKELRHCRRLLGLRS